MQANRGRFVMLLLAVALVAATRVAVSGAPQAGPGQPPQAPAPGARGLQTFPAQQRPPGDPVVVERGKQVYGISCRACHGADLRGGDMGGPNLLRSDVMLNDANGELLLPVVRGGRGAMPPIDLPAPDVTAVAIYIHSVLATAQRQGGPPPGPAITLNVLVGNAAAGEAYFNAKCGSCHSTAGDLKGIGARVSDPMQLQNLWVGGGRVAGGFGGGGGGGGGAGGARPAEPENSSSRRVVTATVRPSSGPAVTGRLDRIDDFTVTLVLSDGTRRTFRRTGDVPNVDVNDPLSVHKKMLEAYTDTDIHNVTAYLVTVK